MTTKIKSWQIDLGFETHPMYHVWVIWIQESLLDHMRWVQDDLTSSNTWRTFKDILQQPLPLTFWNDIPNTDTQHLWKTKAACLQQLLVKLHYMYQRFSYEPHLADIYREKTDHAIRYLDELNINANCQIPILLRSVDDPTNRTYAEQLARDIINERTKWTIRIKKLEDIRISAKHMILYENTVSTIEELTDQYIQQIDECAKQWTSI